MKHDLFDWGAHGYAVLVSAFCRNELSVALPIAFALQAYENFVSVKNRNPHAASVRSPGTFI